MSNAVARKRSDIARGRPAKTRAARKAWSPIPLELTMDHRKVAEWVTGRNVIVVGAAPLAEPISVKRDELVVVVNGSISSVPNRVPDIFLINSRVREFMHWNLVRRTLNQTMLDQCSGRRVRVLGFMNVQDGAEAFTAARLAQRGCTYEKSFVMNRDARRVMEVALGCYPKEEARKYVVSLGVSAVAMMLWAGAAHVRMRGFSYAPGYAYLSREKNAKLPSNARGHANQDRQVLRVITGRYRERVSGDLVGGTA